MIFCFSRWNGEWKRQTVILCIVKSLYNLSTEGCFYKSVFPWSSKKYKRGSSYVTDSTYIKTWHRYFLFDTLVLGPLSDTWHKGRVYNRVDKTWNVKVDFLQVNSALRLVNSKMRCKTCFVTTLQTRPKLPIGLALSCIGFFRIYECLQTSMSTQF